MNPVKKLLILALVIASLTILVAPVAAQSDLFRVTSTTNVRTGHGIEYPVIGQVYTGYVFDILAYSPTANWVQLDLGNGRNGWVFAHNGEITRLNNNTPIVSTNPPVVTTTTTTSNAGQGGGFPAPSTTVIVTVPSSTLGQGGGAPAPITSSTQITGIMTIEEFNSTVGVTASANMRRGPALWHNVVWIIPYGERVVPVARNANGTWILVQYAGREGWVFFELIAAPPAIDLTALPVR
jgi:N-acetylmuramoyl-L-alanine amidase